MKRIIALILVLLMIFALFGCGKSKTETKNENTSSSGTQQQKESGNASKPAAPAKPSGVEWKEITYTTTDSDGYKFEVTFRLSPWILLSNTDKVNAVWAEVSNGKPMPEYGDWGLESYQNGMWRPNNLNTNLGGGGYFYCQGMNDMYYCIGSVSIKNITEGWSLSEDNKRSKSICLSWSDEKVDGIQGAQMISRVFMNSKTHEDGNGYFMKPILTSDDWGPTPFIVMAPEAFTPNYPNGRYYDHWYSGHFGIGDSFVAISGVAFENDIYLGIIGKDGTYLPPKTVEQISIEPGKDLTLKKAEGNRYFLAESGNKTLTWDAGADSWYDKDTECWIWYNTGLKPAVWQYWYDGISSDFGDYGWMEYDTAEGWFIERSSGDWITLPENYDTSNLWYIG